MTARPGEHSGTGSVFLLFKIMLYKGYIELKRYPINTVSNFVVLFIFFLLIFAGGSAIAGEQFGDSLDGIIVGFFLFTLASGAYAGVADSVMKESEWGTLERLYMSPHRFVTAVGLDAVVTTTLTTGFAVILLGLMMLTTGRWLTIDPLTVTPLVILTLCSVLGIGFVIGGLALVYKRVENLFQLLQIGFIGLIAAPVDRFWFLRLLPVSHGSFLLRRAVTENVHLWEFPASELAVLVGVSVSYLIVGCVTFQMATNMARDRGVMGHY